MSFCEPGAHNFAFGRVSRHEREAMSAHNVVVCTNPGCIYRVPIGGLTEQEIKQVKKNLKMLDRDEEEE